MKRFILCLFAAAGMLAACKNNLVSAPDKNTENHPIAAAEPAANKLINILGSYVGEFGDNKITVLITKAAGDSISGRSIVGGNNRIFAGTMQSTPDAVTISAKEPGDNKNDGSFTFNMNKADADKLTGSWAPYKEKNNSSKSFSLSRRAFVYSPDAGSFPQSSKRLLKDADVNNMMKSELEYMRNEIFARHGYCFSRKDTRMEFELTDWYVPYTTDIKNSLSEIEKKNITLIKKYEKYAADYGDDFGR